MKKAITINACNEIHLDQGNNIYKLNNKYFREIRKSEVYGNI